LQYVAIALGVVVLLNLVLGVVVALSTQTPVGLAKDFNACLAGLANPAQTPINVTDITQASGAVTQLANLAFNSISFNGIADNPGLIAGLSIGALAVAGLWVFLLYKFTKAMVWGTLIFNVLLVAAVGGYFFTLPGTTEVAFTYFGLAALLALALFFFRSNVNMAAGLLHLAMQAIKEYPSLILAAIIINVLVLGIYVLQLVFTVSAFLNLAFYAFTAEQLMAAETAATVMDPASITGDFIFVEPGFDYCVLEQTIVSKIGVAIFSLTLVWTTFTLEAVRMAMVSTVFGVFYYFSPEDPTRPSGIVCKSTVWAFTRQLGTHAISGMVLAIIDQLRRASRTRGGGIGGVILRLIIMCILSIVGQLTKFLVVLTGLTGLSFWESAKRTMTVMKEAFVDGYVTSRFAVRVLRVSGFCFALAFAMASWAGVDSSTISSLWFMVFIIIVGIISPIFGIILSLLLSSIFGFLVNNCPQNDDGVPCHPDPNAPNPLSGPLAGLFFGSIAHAILLFMEQLILDLVDAAFMCFALDAHNRVVSARGEVVHRFMNAEFSTQLAESYKTAAASGGVPIAMPASAMVAGMSTGGAPPPGAYAPPPPAAYPSASTGYPAAYPGTSAGYPTAYPVPSPGYQTQPVYPGSKPSA
jgi:hypothetical protein